VVSLNIFSVAHGKGVFMVQVKGRRNVNGGHRGSAIVVNDGGIVHQVSAHIGSAPSSGLADIGNATRLGRSNSV